MKLEELCKRADLAIRLGSNEYAVAVCQHILSYFPRHTQAHSLLGQAYLEQGALAKAAEQFKAVIEVDPENVLARSALGVVYGGMDDLPAAIEQFERAYQISPNNPDIAEGLKQLYAQRDGEEPAQLKTPIAAVARWHSSKKQYSQALKEFDQVITAQDGRIELQLARAEALWRGGMLRDAERACMQVLQKAPNTLKAKLILAEIMTRDKTRERQGLALLHEALGIDPGGTLVKEMFRDTPFKVPNLGEEIELPTPNGGTVSPPEVEAAISMLPKSAPVEPETAMPDELELEDVTPIDGPKGLNDADLARFQADLQRIGNLLLGSQQRSEPVGPSTTTTAEAIITSRSKLIAKYGQEGFDRLDRKLKEFQEALKGSDVDAQIIYVDDDASLEPFGLKPVDPEKPEMIKNLVDRLEKSLAQNQRKLSYVLIVGGDSIIPFHRLRNPTEDEDENVPSDNPYASRDADFLIPQRAIGRMPDAEGGGISFLLGQLETAIAHKHKPSQKVEPLGCLGVLLSLGISVKFPQLRTSSLGLSALVWKDASAAVYEAIGDAKALLTSPPVTEAVFNVNWLLGSSLSYFNLHGAKDSENWYGQKDYSYPDDYPMLPVALSPKMIAEANVASSVIFSEACYGANILGKDSSSSLALRFVADGAIAFVGSTVTSYGVPAPPLSNADLLAVHFWQNMTNGLSAGEALMRAKQSFMNEIAERQGWLDGDDQKTLLEFVLYGDPSSHLDKMPDSNPKSAYQPLATTKGAFRSRPHLLCQHRTSAKSEGDVPVDLIHRVVGHLHECCPEMHGGSLKIHGAMSCNGQCGLNCQCGAGGLHSHGIGPLHKLTLFTSHRALPTADGKEVRRFARATVNHAGDIVKTTVSR